MGSIRENLLAFPLPFLAQGVTEQSRTRGAGQLSIPLGFHRL
jgi:hypothetical protein